MVFKRYIKRGGKVYGPYYYKSYRDKNGIVRKKYLGITDPTKDKKKNIIRKNSLKKNYSFTPQFNSKLFTIILLVLVILGLFFISSGGLNSEVVSMFQDPVFLPFSSISGFVVSEIAGDNEQIVEEFDNDIDLEIKDPPKLGEQVVSVNKNKRMDFDINGGLRLYFDLLNYSEFVENVGERFVNEDLINKSEVVEEDTNKTILDNESEAQEIENEINKTILDNESEAQEIENEVNFTDVENISNNETEEQIEGESEVVEEPQTGYGEGIGNSLITANVVSEGVENTETGSKNVNFSRIKQEIEDLEDGDIEEITRGAVVKLENEEFEVEVNETAAEEQGVDYKWGYKVKLKDLNFMAKIDVTSDNEIFIFDNNSLMIGNNLLSFEDLINEGYKVRIEKPTLEIEENKSRVIENIIKIVEEDETDNESRVIKNETQTGYGENEEDIVSEESEAEVVEEETEVEQPIEGIVEEQAEVVEEEIQEEVVSENEEIVEIIEKEQTGYGITAGITGGIIRAFSITGRAVGLGEGDIEVQDLEYENTVTIFIEKDFTDVKNPEGELYKVGDIVYLDPTLIEIERAVHLDENRNFISDIYEDVKALDGNWSEIINNSEYVRVTFERNLTNKNDISVFAKDVSSGQGPENSTNATNAKIEVYRENGNKTIAIIENISSEGLYQTYLTGLEDGESHSTFDLKIIGQMIFDYIVDPTVAPDINFTTLTPVNATSTTNTSLIFNFSIEKAGDLNEVKYNWNGTNYTMYNDSLVLMFNFNNVTSLGEGTKDNITVDVSNGKNNGTCIQTGYGCNYTSGKYGYGLEFNGSGNYVNVSTDLDLSSMSRFTISSWVYLKSKVSDRDIVGQGTTSCAVELRYDVGEDYWEFDVYDGGWQYAKFSQSNVVLNRWTHVVGVYDGGLKIYVDGVLGATTDTVGTICDGSVSSIKIGKLWTGASLRPFNGTIDEVMIWNVSLSQSEVYQLYVSNLRKYDTANWSLYVNQSLNATDGLPLGTYTYFASAKDDAGSENQTLIRTITITVASIPPNVTVNTPLNQTYNTNTIIFNVTALDETAISSCLYTLNGGTDNVTMKNASTSPTSWNATDSSVAQGSNNVTFYCNDTSNNLNWTESVVFFIDSITPDLNITYPINNTNFSTGSVDINFTYTDANCDSAWWSNDSGVNNYSLIGCTENITNITWGDGGWNVTVYVNDSVNNLNWTSVTFRIVIPTIDLAVVYPTTNINVTQNEFFNVSVNITCSKGNCSGINVSFDPFFVIERDINDEGEVSIGEDGVNFNLIDGREFNISYSDKNNKNVSFFKVKDTEELVNKGSLRYIKQGVVNPVMMTGGYRVFSYGDSVPTLRTYIGSNGYVFYGNRYAEESISDFNNKDYPIIRYKTEGEKGCPVMLSDGEAFVIELHKENITEEDENLFYRAVKDSLAEEGVDVERERFYSGNNLFYYFDGLRIKQIGRMDVDNNNHLIFFMYVDAPDDVSSFSLVEKIKQYYVSSLGDLRDFNDSFDSSIREKIIQKYVEYSEVELYEGEFTSQELEIIDELSDSFNSEEWKMDSEWKGISEDYGLNHKNF
ncbi:MAG: LamG domain-containing protein, partial [archaeon]